VGEIVVGVKVVRQHHLSQIRLGTVDYLGHRASSEQIIAHGFERQVRFAGDEHIAGGS